MLTGDSRRHVPRVIRNAAIAAVRPSGYSPALGVKMAAAHRWATYDEVAAALRDLALVGQYWNEFRLDRARETLARLFRHSAPFNADARFPEGEVYLSVDHGVFGQCVLRILTELLRIEAAAAAGAPGQIRMVDACDAFMKAVAAAAATLARTEEEPGKPVLYDRVVFEEAFGLTWRIKTGMLP